MRRRAFTLLEMIIVLILLLAIGSAAVPALESLIASTTQRETREQVQAAVTEARAQVMRDGRTAKLVATRDESAPGASAKPWRLVVERLRDSPRESATDGVGVGGDSAAQEDVSLNASDDEGAPPPSPLLELPARWSFVVQAPDEPHVPLEHPLPTSQPDSAPSNSPEPQNPPAPGPVPPKPLGSASAAVDAPRPPGPQKIPIAVLWPSGECEAAANILLACDDGSMWEVTISRWSATCELKLVTPAPTTRSNRDDDRPPSNPPNIK